ncbi:BTB/POZ domain [Popillia japonica]|uniref:BTB/POZ domain n=1 Tax=Popillia japonica TaxID=7064 RepID=A0AAW1KI16_POPJA
MGSAISTNLFPYSIVTNVSDFVRGTKRKLSERDGQDDLEKVIEIAMHTPKRKKVETTAQYIYQALFSLKKSPYFASMFGGGWLETEKNSITIDIIDPLITINSLKIVFGSLYCDEIILNPVEVIPILATATMFQLDGIIDKCREVMLETINPKTALDYYMAGCQYGDNKLKDSCIRWFLINLMGHYYNLNQLEQLRLIPTPLMIKLISHPDLCVMKTEITLYVLLTQWMYLQLHQDEAASVTSLDISNFFMSRKGETPFLLTEEGQTFVCVFQNLRLQHLISHHMDVELLLKDNVLPRGWIHNVVLKQWRAYGCRIVT